MILLTKAESLRLTIIALLIMLLACGGDDDIADDGVDTTPPVITVLGDNPMELEQGDTYIDPGISAVDAVDGNITDFVVDISAVDTDVIGTYVVSYSVSDNSGNTAMGSREVRVIAAASTFACSDGIDNDGDGETDFPNDPGCTDANDDDETDPATFACSDGNDNDGDGLIDFPNDPGCSSQNDNSEVDGNTGSNGVPAHAWTTFTASSDTQIVYVRDSTGSDSTGAAVLASNVADPFDPTTSEATPFKSLSAAMDAYDDLPNNQPHWILLKSGDTWTNQNIGTWSKAGRSTTEPAVLASYGTSTQQPTILTGSGSFSASVRDDTRFVIIADIFIHAHTNISADAHNSLKAFRWIPDSGLSGDWIFEGIHIRGFGTAMLLGSSQPPFLNAIKNVTIRNSVIDRTQGENAIYISGVTGAKVYEGNVFYDNGYSFDHSEGNFRAKHIYHDNENGYVNNGDPDGITVVRDNLFVDSAAHSIQIRTGGEIYSNFFTSHGIGLTVGNHDTGQSWPIVDVSIHDNVILHLDDSTNQALGYGMYLENVNADVEYNIMAYYDSDHDVGRPFWYTGEAGNTSSLTLTNNTFYDIVGEIRHGGSVNTAVQSNNMANDDFQLQSSDVYSSDVSFTDSSVRDLASYNINVLNFEGSAADSRADFMAEAAKQWRGYYRVEYTVDSVIEYVRGAFTPDGAQPDNCNKGAVPCE